MPDHRAEGGMSGDDTVVSFEGGRGGTWSYDPARPLAPPGGFGTVFAGWSNDGDGVAVKVIRSLGEGALAERLQAREVEIAERLRDSRAENLMPVLDVGRTGRDVLLVMPRAEGSLATRPPVDYESALAALRDVAHGLQELHEASIFHRDLKPGNVLWHEGRWRLADFGIARDDSIGTQTATYAGGGTSAYMAPELWVPPYTPTAKSDLYAFGIMAFQVLTGGLPFAGPTDADFERQHREDVSSPLPSSMPSVLVSLVRRLLLKMPSERPQDARAVSERLARVAAVAPPLHQELQRLTAEHDAGRQRDEAARMAELSRLRERQRQRTQLESDLSELLDDAASDLQDALPGVEVGGCIPRGFVLSTSDAEARVRLWNPFTSQVEGDGMIVAGDVTLSSRRGSSFVAANLVGEAGADGRLVWNVYRFRRSAIVAQYEYGPWDREHGMASSVFEDPMERDCMLRTVTHAWTLRRFPLTATTIVELFREALAL